MGGQGEMPLRASVSVGRTKITRIRIGGFKRCLVLFSLGAIIFWARLITRINLSESPAAANSPIAEALGTHSTKDKKSAAISKAEKIEKAPDDKKAETISKDEEVKRVPEGGKDETTSKGEKIPNDKETEKITVRLSGKKVEMPSAKTLLSSKLPFKDSDAIDLYPANSNVKSFIKSPNTIVTGYFQLRSKYHSSEYDNWMRSMLSLQDAMIIFTEPDLVDRMKVLRSHAVDRTIIIPLALNDLPIGKLFPEKFWQDQLRRDPERRMHRSHELFWIWLSKSWFVTQAIRMNVFDSDLFLWSDIGCFRQNTYRSKTLIQHRETVPDHEILQMAHHVPNPPKEILFNDKYKQKEHFYHSGSQLVGFKDTWVTFHKYFLETIDRFLEKNMIIVEDQAVLQSTCLSYPEICAYVPYGRVNDNHYFGLRHVLHHGDKLDYWRYNPGAKGKNSDPTSGAKGKK